MKEYQDHVAVLQKIALILSMYTFCTYVCIFYLDHQFIADIHHVSAYVALPLHSNSLTMDFLLFLK